MEFEILVVFATILLFIILFEWSTHTLTRSDFKECKKKESIEYKRLKAKYNNTLKITIENEKQRNCG